MKSTFQDTRKITSIRRMLHIIALLQNNKDPRNWNNNTLARTLAYDPHDELVDDSAIKNCLKSIRDDTEIELTIKKGGNRISPIEFIKKDYLKELLTLYTSLVVTDETRNSLLKRLIDKCETECMWNIANIYFASHEKKMISFTYTNNEGVRKDNIIFKPYHLVAKGHNIYLLGKKRGETEVRQYILEKIENVRLEDTSFDDVIPEQDSYFKYSISPYMATPVEMKIKYDKKIAQEIRQILGFLGEIEAVGIGKKKRTQLEITEYEIDDHYETEFKIADHKHLMKHLFYYGKHVEILKPAKYRNEMKSMLQESLSVYE